MVYSVANNSSAAHASIKLTTVRLYMTGFAPGTDNAYLNH